MTLNDSNSILSEFSFKSQNGITVSQSGNKLTLTSSNALNDTVTFTSAKAIPNVGIVVLVPYGDASLLYAFLTIRFDDATVMDFMIYAVKYFIFTQQLYCWREKR